MNAAATEKRALNGIPSANLQMCGFYNNLLVQEERFFLFLFFWGFGMCCYKKKPNR